MNNKGVIFIAFITGIGIGSVGTWQFLKKKFEQLAQEEIDSVKKSYASKERNAFVEVEKNVINGFNDGIVATEKQETESIEKYASILKEEGYTKYSRRVEEKKGDPFMEKPYVISPEEFGEFEEYEKISLTYYADQVLADENDELVDDVEEIVGENSLTHFGEYEEDSVFVRNDRLKCDYEILLDQREYSKVIQHMPHRVEEK